MFKKSTSKKTVMRDLAPVKHTVKELRPADLALVTGSKWNPSWTSPQDPDDIFRDDG